MNLAVLIPAFRPGRSLVSLVEKLARTPVPAIVIVDDGSGPRYKALFEECQRLPRVHLLRHAINLGKGAALKTGINYALCSFPDHIGVVTADADGQHLPEDVLRVAERLTQRPECLVLGARQFDKHVPFRSRFGNALTRSAVRFLMGSRLSDTQTGLRGIPRSLLPHLLKIVSNGYEFELDMLIACKHHECEVVEERIETVYLEANKSSHFNPLLDSMRIYFVLLRFSTLSLLTAVVDNIVFYISFGWTLSVLQAQVTGRVAAVLFNYGAARKAVFLSHERHRALLPKYLLLVFCSGLVSYGLINFFSSVLPVKVIWAKMTAETILFFANFVIQRDFVFTRRQSQAAATDWDRYYESVPFTANITRRYTAAVLVSALKRYAGFGKAGAKTLVELGGANSCFLTRIFSELRPQAYHIVDNNEYGLDLVRQRLENGQNVLLHRQNVLNLSLDVEADAVFSVGLIEHFNAAETRKVIRAHFDPLRWGGCAILSFPTPTLLYRAARAVVERLGLWRFPDERPLLRSEVLESIEGLGQVLFEKTLWPLVFTQHFMVIRKLEAGSPLQVTASE